MSEAVRVLIVDDDLAVCKLLRQYFEGAAYKVCEAHDIEDARTKLSANPFNLVMLDLYFGEQAAGRDLAREIRTTHNCGIIAMSGIADRAERIEIIRATVDDSIGKPLEEDEVLARASAVLRRFGIGNGAEKKAPAAPGIIATFAGWVLNLKRHDLVSPQGKEVKLTMGEFNLLYNFVMHPNEVLTREQIIEMDTSIQSMSPPDRAVDMRISRLRHRMAKESSDDVELIRTVRGAGYMLVTDVSWSNGDNGRKS
jgi:two-component system, OmpR family, response regulator